MAKESANRIDGAVQMAVVTTVANENHTDATAQATMVTTVSVEDPFAPWDAAHAAKAERATDGDTRMTAVTGGIERESGVHTIAVRDGNLQLGTFADEGVGDGFRNDGGSWKGGR